MSTTSGPNVPLRTGKLYLVPPIETAASAVSFSTAPFLRKFSVTYYKNPMAVELAKVALWLHSFTVGAPLSFLDHHLRCGDSLFGSWVKTGIEKATAYGSPLLLHEPIKTALGSAASMQTIEGLPDAEIAEVHRSQEIFEGVQVMTAPLNAFLALLHAIEWQGLKGKDNAKAIQGFFDGSFGNPFEVALGKREPQVRDDHGRRFVEILSLARELIAEERFLNWQVAFPGVWTDWEGDGLTGGFDAIIGNPPWDRMKLQQVEWFAARKREIALAQRAADRERMIDELRTFPHAPLLRRDDFSHKAMAINALNSRIIVLRSEWRLK